MISELTQEQEKRIFRTTCEFVAAEVQRRPARNDGSPSTDLIPPEVKGCFVTLKRRGQLRGCCGTVGRPVTFPDTLHEVATTTALHDVRLPPVSSTELAYLDVSVSLLYGFRPIQSHGEDRVGEVSVGEHGLRIQCGQSAGLLLPSVAVELGLTPESFLRHVCHKAGLPSEAWKDKESRLLTFRSHVIEGPLELEAVQDDTSLVASWCTMDELTRIAEHCHSNLVNLMCGATPSYYAAGCPDGTVHGVAIHVCKDSDTHSCEAMSLRPGIPLQATLLNLCQQGFNRFVSLGWSMEDLQRSSVDITILTDPALHGSVSHADFRGFDAKHRACLVTEGNKSVWVHDPHQDPDQLLQLASQRAHVVNPDGAMVFSLHAHSTVSPVTVANVPQAKQGNSVRPPAVAGTFYPNHADELNQLVDQLLSNGDSTPESFRAIMVPHAGLRYSGHIAASVFQRTKIPETVIIIGPKHTRFGVDWAVAPHDSWSIPGAQIASDVLLARRLADAIPGLELDSAAHAQEHGVEVELPLLARLAPDSQVVGITLGRGSIAQCRQFANGLSKVISEMRPRPLLVISSDMNHFASEEENHRLDKMALDAMKTLDPTQLYDTVMGHRISMCGLIPAMVVMETLQLMGGRRYYEQIAYGTSADISGDTSRVVGYAGVVLS